jgi:hypothetical protein
MDSRPDHRGDAVTRSDALRFIAAHERAAASADRPEKRVQHLASAAHYREAFDLPAPDWHPPAAAIFEQLRALGLDDVVQDFWRFHAGQADGAEGQLNYQRAYLRLRKRAVTAIEAHQCASVWIPVPVGYSAPMEFVEVKLRAAPKSDGRQWFNQSEVTT